MDHTDILLPRLSISTDGKCIQADETFKVLDFVLSRPEAERTPVSGQTELFECTSTP